MNEIASRYALALFSISEDLNLTESFQYEIKEIISILSENDDFKNVLNSSFLTKEERKDIIKKTFVGVNDNIIHLIEILIDNDRINYLMEVMFAYNSYANEKRGVKEGFVYSTEYLDKDLLKKITTSISEAEKMPVELKNLIDSRLIGGIKVVIGNHVYDGSVKNRLELLKTNLINKEGEK